MEKRRVVVTGIGALTPIGNTAPEFWEGLVAGKSGAAPITHFDASKFKTQFACEVKNFDPLAHFDKKEAKKMDRNTQLGLVAAKEAVAHSRIIEDEVNKDRVGVVWGSGIGGLGTFEAEVLSNTTFSEAAGLKCRTNKIPPATSPPIISNTPTAIRGIRYFGFSCMIRPSGMGDSWSCLFL